MLNKFEYYLLIALLVIVHLIRTSYCEVECETFDRCGACLEHPQCVWCRKMNGSNRPPGCISREDANEVCASESFIEDTLINLRFITDDPLTVGSSENPILLRPQKIHLSNMREGNAYNVSVTFRQVVDYPVDLYFVMDASHTMFNTIKYLAKMSANITNNMRSLTRKISVGLGTFVDKNIAPFARSEQNPYTFKNELELTDNITLFQEIVGRRKESVPNNDPAESVLDAALQAIVCSDRVKWRKEARKIIIVATDALPHIAGDGKLAGINKPNDGECHLNASDVYDMALEQDYASFGLIAHTIKKHSVNVIFAIKRDSARRPYDSLARMAKGSIDVVSLSETTLVSSVENQYRQIASKVQLVHDPLEFVRVTYLSSCVDGNLTQRNECEQLQLDKEVNFTIGIEVIKCPAKVADRKQTLVIKAYGYQDTLAIDIDINCYCPCEKAEANKCPSRCDDFKDCVECEQAPADAQNDADDKCSKCRHLAKFVKENEPIEISKASERGCAPIQDIQTGCATDFKYGYEDDAGQIVVRYIGDQRCPPPFPLAVTSFSLMGAIVAIGIVLMLVWRLLLYLYDRKEYARFIEESKKANWNTGANPLYVGASTTVLNPAFRSQ